MVSGVSVVDCKWGKILRKMVVVCLIFVRMLRAVFFVFVFLSFICILLFKMLIVSIYLEINGMPMILCLISVMGNICLNSLFKNLFCSIVLVGRRTNRIFP